MSRVKLLPLESVEGLEDLAAMYQNIYGFVPNGVRAMAHRPKLVDGFVALRKAVMGPDSGTVPSELKEMIANLASKAAGCRYCQAHTVFGAENAGASAERLANLWNYKESPLFTEGEKVAFDLALAAGSVPNGTSDELFEQLHEHWDDGQIVEILAVVALFGFLNRWNDSLATPLEGKSAESAEKHLGPQGWNIGKHKE